MSEWKEYKLGEVGEIITGKTPSVRNPEDWGNKFLFITPSDYCNYGKYAKDSIRKLSVFGLERLKMKVLPPKSILVTCIGSDMGKVVMNNVMCITNQQINAIVPYKEYDNDFVYYSLLNAYDTLRVLGGDGTAVPIVNKSDFENIVLKLPPLDEQKRIAGVLSSLDDKIDLLNRENATLEALAETLFRHYFIENPDPTWKEGKIADLVDFNPNRKLTKNEDSPYIDMANIETQGYAPSSWRMRPFASGTKFINGDAIMARISPCLENGKAAYIDFLEDGQVGWGSTEFLVMRSKMGLHPFFAYIMTRYDDFRDHAVSSLVGLSGRQRVDLDNLLKYSIFIPDEKAITRFNREMEMIVSKMRNNQLQMRTLAFQRDIILPRLMSGEVKVIGL